jgi:hypothetical protein
MFHIRLIVDVLGDGELPEVVPNHFRLDLHLVELLARIDAHDAANHLRDDNHVTQVRPHDVRLLVRLGLLLGLAQLLDEAHGLALETAVEPPSRARMHDVAELLGAEIEESVCGECQTRP